VDFNHLVDLAHDLVAELAETRRERDLAVAHDRQPYPTQDAYDAACRALEKHRQRANAAEAERDDYRDRLKATDAAWAKLATERDALRAQVASLLDELEAADGRDEAQRLRSDAWRQRCVALDQLLVCFRTGRQPTEALHRELERTRTAIHDLAGTDG
jgi:septal ring factor EnvC (AmiA/AmiB activator)